MVKYCNNIDPYAITSSEFETNADDWSLIEYWATIKSLTFIADTTASRRNMFTFTGVPWVSKTAAKVP